MTLVKRRVILFFTVLLFISLSIVLVSYAMGYRLNTNYNEVRQVGIIDVANTPSAASVFLDGEKIAGKTPFQIKDLYTGKYTIRTEKDDHTAWEKEIFVNAREVSWIRNARNFLIEPKNTEVISGDIAHAVQSKNLSSIVFIDTKDNKIQLQSLRPANQKTLTITTFKDTISDISDVRISDNGKIILVSYIDADVQKWGIISNNKEQEIAEIQIQKNIEPIEDTEIQEIKPLKKIDFSNANNDEVFILEKETLSRINTLGEREIFAENVIDFETNTKGIHVIEKDDNNILTAYFTKKSTFSFNEEVKEHIVTIPSQELINFKTNAFNDIAINTHNKGLLLFNNESKRLVELGDNISSFIFGRNTRKIIFNSKDEVLFYEMAREEDEFLRQAYPANQANLLTRLDNEAKKGEDIQVDNQDLAINSIKSIGFYADEAWAWITLDNTVKLIELDERGSHNEYTIDASATSSLFQDKDGETFYYLTKKEIETSTTESTEETETTDEAPANTSSLISTEIL